MSKTFICKGCKEKYDINMQSSNTGYCYICNEFYMKQQLATMEKALENAVFLEQDHYVIITNGWKNKKYGIAKVVQVITPHYIQETDGRLGCYVPCMEFGKFATKEEALAKLEEIKNETTK